MPLLEQSAHQRAVTFTNGNGQRLAAMAYLPQGERRRDTAVLVSVNSIKYRIGSFRYHHLLCRHLARAGFPLLCFDPAGVGDSEGRLETRPVPEVFVAIQNGLYDDDNRCAIEACRRTFGVDRVIMLGLCGGAVSSIITGAEDDRVAGFVLLGIPILYDRTRGQAKPAAAAKPRSEVDYVTSDRQAKRMLGQKLTGLLSPKVWKKIFTGGFDVRQELNLLVTSLRKLVAGKVRKPARPAAISPADFLAKPASDHERLNLNVQRGLIAAWQRRKPVLLVFGALDPVTGEFEESFGKRLLHRDSPLRETTTFTVIDQANHIFSASDSQRELTATIEAWLDRQVRVVDASGRPAG